MRLLYRLRTLWVIPLLWCMTIACSLVDESERIKGPQWTPEIALPLVKTEITFSQVLDEIGEQDWLDEDGEGLLSIVYESESLRFPALDVLDLPKITVPMLDTMQTVGFPLNEIGRMHLKNGTLAFEYQSALSTDYNLRIRFEQAQQAGQSLEVVLPQSGPGTQTGSLDLSGYFLELEESEISLSYRAEDPVTGQYLPLTAFFFTLDSLEYRFIEGFFGQQDLSSGSENFSFDLTSAFSQLDRLRLSNPQLQLRFQNSFGVPIELRADTLDFETSAGTIGLDHEGLTQGTMINYPNLSQVGERVPTVININKENSEIVEILASLPEALKYNFSATTFPEGKGSENGFVLDTSSLEVEIGVEVPLDLQLEPVALRTQMDANFQGLDLFEAATFKLVTENGFPLSLSVQAYFLDENGQTVDSLFATPSLWLQAAPVDGNGKVSAANVLETEVPIPADRLEALEAAERIEIKTLVHTSENGQVPVKFYSHYQLGIQLGVLVEGRN
ncbi:MAG: hypothetical protein AAFR61_19385 [Bacteroidota bacterium]